MTIATFQVLKSDIWSVTIDYGTGLRSSVRLTRPHMVQPPINSVTSCLPFSPSSFPTFYGTQQTSQDLPSSYSLCQNVLSSNILMGCYYYFTFLLIPPLISESFHDHCYSLLTFLRSLSGLFFS